MMVRPHFAPVLLGGLILATAAGCRDDEIRRYQVPRPETSPTRMLAALVPAGERVWFVKVSGPAPAVAERQSEFEQFVRSFRFPAPGNEPAWDVPEGWRKVDSKERLRFATFRIGPQALELTVSFLGREGGSDLLANVNRWRGQLGLPDTTAAELPKVTRTLQVGNSSATVVDLTGPAPGAAKAGADPVPVASASRPLTYEVPPGWREVPPRSMRVVDLQIVEGDRKAETTVIPLAGDAGGLAANVNRWRKEVGLPDVTEEQVRKDAKSIEVAGAPATYVDLLGPEAAGTKRERTLGVILPRGERTWFFKLRGSADVVAKHQPAFEAFLRSVRFPAGGNP